MLILSDHAKKHLEDIKRYLSKFNDPIDPLSNEVLTFLERVKGIPQTPNLRLGESERWRIVLHFRSCAKIRYVIAKRSSELILVTVHPDPDTHNYIEILR